MELAEQVEPPVPIVRACEVLGVSRATLYRHTSPPALREPRELREPRPVPRRLDAAERAAIVEVLHSPEFVDQPPHEVYAALLTRGIYPPPSQFEAWFLSAAHTDRDVTKTIAAAHDAMREVKRSLS